MRLHLITAALLLAGGPVLASSIETVTSRTSTSSSSIVTKTCSDCPAVKIAKTKRSYVVPQLTPGTQTTEVRDVDGQKKLVRTEAWLGGSPVVFINKAPAEDASTAATEDAPRNDQAAESTVSADGVDKTATTSAVAVKPAGDPVAATADTAAVTPLDTSGFDLRTK